MYFFARGDATKAQQSLLGDVSHCSVLQWYRFLRELLTTDMLQRNLMIGGPGHIVEIDESLYHGQREFQVGRVILNTPWLFGAIDQNTKKVSVFVVASRTAAESEARIRDCILPGSTMHSDEVAGIQQSAQHQRLHTQNCLPQGQLRESRRSQCAYSGH